MSTGWRSITLRKRASGTAIAQIIWIHLGKKWRDKSESTVIWIKYSRGQLTFLWLPQYQGIFMVAGSLSNITNWLLITAAESKCLWNNRDQPSYASDLAWYQPFSEKTFLRQITIFSKCSEPRYLCYWVQSVKRHSYSSLSCQVSE